MPIIAVKCPGCGGDIRMDDSKPIGFCIYCGTQVMVRDNAEAKVIIEAKVSVEGLATLEKLNRNAVLFFELGEYGKASEVYKKIVNEYPEDYRGWWGIIQTGTGNFRVSERLIATDSAAPAPYSRERDIALRLAPGEIRQRLQKQYSAWFEESLKKRKEVDLRKEAERKRIKVIGQINEQKEIISRAEWQLSHKKIHRKDKKIAKDQIHDAQLSIAQLKSELDALDKYLNIKSHLE